MISTLKDHYALTHNEDSKPPVGSFVRLRKTHPANDHRLSLNPKDNNYTAYVIRYNPVSEGYVELGCKKDITLAVNRYNHVKTFDTDSRLLKETRLKTHNVILSRFASDVPVDEFKRGMLVRLRHGLEYLSNKGEKVQDTYIVMDIGDQGAGSKGLITVAALTTSGIIVEEKVKRELLCKR